MVKAMESVKEGMSVRGASMKFSVPHKTLEDRVKGRVPHGTNPGVKIILSKTVEDMAKRGFPLTRTMVKVYAWAIANYLGMIARIWS